jgi:hypothetical protein
MLTGVRYKVGDRLLISCEPRPVVIRERRRRHVTVDWPWREKDLRSRYRWNGQNAVATDPSTEDWKMELWRLKGGTIFIPATEVTVVGVYEYDPPLYVGWLPRPNTAIDVTSEKALALLSTSPTLILGRSPASQATMNEADPLNAATASAASICTILFRFSNAIAA